ESDVVLNDGPLLDPPDTPLGAPRGHDDDLDVRGLGAREPRADRRAGVPHVAQHVAAPEGRRPAREYHVELRRLVVAGALADVSPFRKLDDLPRPREKGELAEVDHHVPVEGERRLLAPEPEGQAVLVPDELHRCPAHELLRGPPRRYALGR